MNRGGIRISWFVFKDEHEKVVSIAIVGLLLVAGISIIAAVSLYFANASITTSVAPALITLAGTAVGGVAGFIAHKSS